MREKHAAPVIVFAPTRCVSRVQKSHPVQTVRTIHFVGGEGRAERKSTWLVSCEMKIWN